MEGVDVFVETVVDETGVVFFFSGGFVVVGGADGFGVVPIGGLTGAGGGIAFISLSFCKNCCGVSAMFSNPPISSMV